MAYPKILHDNIIARAASLVASSTAPGTSVLSLAHINQIKSAQFGSATSAPSIAGGNAVPVFDATTIGAPGAALQEPGANIAPARQQVSLTFQGSGRYTYDEVVNGILPLVSEAAGNGVDIVVNQG